MEYLRAEGADRPDLVLLDLNLPRKDGREVLEEIKSDPALRSIPVVVLTTSKAEEDILRSYDLHANAYVTKPVDFNRFIEVVRQIDEFFVTVVKLPGAPPAAAMKRWRVRCSRSPVLAACGSAGTAARTRRDRGRHGGDCDRDADPAPELRLRPPRRAGAGAGAADGGDRAVGPVGDRVPAQRRRAGGRAHDRRGSCASRRAAASRGG